MSTTEFDCDAILAEHFRSKPFVLDRSRDTPAARAEIAARPNNLIRWLRNSGFRIDEIHDRGGIIRINKTMQVSVIIPRDYLVDCVETLIIQNGEYNEDYVRHDAWDSPNFPDLCEYIKNLCEEN